MKAAVIVFPGSNCDRDIQVALAASLGQRPQMIWHGESKLPALDLIVVPGGFSYGDYLRAGAVAAKSPVMAEVAARARAGVPVLGVCNGFQILIEAGLLPGALMRNAGLRFVCRDVCLRVENARSVFTQGYSAGDVIRLPVAHLDGNYFADEGTLDALEDADRIAFRYCAANGGAHANNNPNGSARAIAGVFNEGKTILGMMPHPERLADDRLGGNDGRALFDGLVAALAGAQ
jgi:phosphoribosylformylglycinamidine synthase I